MICSNSTLISGLTKKAPQSLTLHRDGGARGSTLFNYVNSSLSNLITKVNRNSLLISAIQLPGAFDQLAREGFSAGDPSSLSGQ